jgi:adenylosuccinate lyase
VTDHEIYQNPLISRYAGRQMAELFSDNNKFGTWRRLWIALAEAQQELGLQISDAQLNEMRDSVDDIDFELAKKKESELRHDVMAHVHTFGEACPQARGIIHWGATSCFVTDNTELIQMRSALELVRSGLIQVLGALARFAQEYANTPTLGFTHFQPAQLTTVGKRASLWAYEFVLDIEELDTRLKRLRFRGVKGTTGTQASFLELFDGDDDKVKALDEIVTEKMEFNKSYQVTGQTYSRKIDAQIGAVLSGIAQTAHKFSNDIRLLQHLKEIEEPFEENQIGSSAMAYKRNPMRTERATALSRYVITASQNPALTAAEQWFERTLDDSANRRIAIPEMFLAVDGILKIVANVASGLVVNEAMIDQNIQRELPFMATENILMAAVSAGGDRQQLHEQIRLHSMAAGAQVKSGGGNDLLERIAADAQFGLDLDSLRKATKPEAFTGRASKQVDELLSEVIAPILESVEEPSSQDDQLRV